MKQSWQKLALRIDAMSLRERVLIFVMAAVVLVVLVNTFVLDAQFAKQKRLSQHITEEQAQIAAIQADIQHKVRLQAADPNAATRQELEHLKRQSAQLRGVLQQTQQALVAPEKMPALLEAMLKRNGRLRLVSLKTLPVSNLAEAATLAKASEGAQATSASPPAADAAAANASGIGAIYRHGVELTVAGTYADMVHYVAQLETVPWQLYWGQANLAVESYPQARLKLILYTLSMDKKWMNL
jgi:MSHA biogenesis protein MshJ